MGVAGTAAGTPPGQTTARTTKTGESAFPPCSRRMGEDRRGGEGEKTKALNRSVEKDCCEVRGGGGGLAPTVRQAWPPPDSAQLAAESRRLRRCRRSIS